MKNHRIVLLFCITFVCAESVSTLRATGVKLPYQIDAQCSNEQIKEFGLLKNVEDAGYPIVILTIEFPERRIIDFYQLNLEEVNHIDAATLTNAIGSYVFFEYNSNLVNDLIDLKWNDKSLVEAGTINGSDAEIKTVTGILSNAAEVTSSDLPGELYVKTEEEITYVFPFYITSEIVKANGKMVMAFYQERTLNTITSIRVSN